VEPKYLCTPVDKNGSGIKDKESHLVCYLLKENIPADVRVEVDNQFGTQQFVVRDRQLVCVPSTKKVIVDGESEREHFHCYNTKNEEFESRGITLADQFNPDKWEDKINSAPFFCTPADKNGEGIKDEKRHLTCYALQAGQMAQKNSRVLVTDQFGKYELLVRIALELCVPSLKEVFDGAPPKPQSTEGLKGNHYTCYSVEVIGGGFDQRTVTIKDQFDGSEPYVVQVEWLCTPVDKNGEGIEDKEEHLLCYRLEKGAEVNRSVLASNQFGGEVLAVLNAAYLCVPATKEVLG